MSGTQGAWHQMAINEARGMFGRNLRKALTIIVSLYLSCATGLFKLFWQENFIETKFGWHESSVYCNHTPTHFYSLTQECFSKDQI